MTGYGWLSHNPDLSDVIAGVQIDRAGTKTRVEEYTLVDEIVRQTAYGNALDAATGYVVGWHMLPYILAARGFWVETIDMNQRTLNMPDHQSIHRQVGNITDMPYSPESCDVVCCISTLEHCSHEEREAFAREAARVVCRGGLLIVTADNYPGVTPAALADLFKEDFDVGEDHGDERRRFPGDKRVAYLVARRKV